MKTKRRANGEGSIYFVEKEQKWRAEIAWIDNNGNQQRKTWKSKKQSEVKAKLTEFKKQLLLNGTDFKPEERKFRDFADEWVNVILKPKIKPLSYQRKVSTLENQVYKHLGNTPMSKITHAQIQKMVNDLTDSGLSYSTVKKAYEAVLGCMRYYRVTTSTAFNPCEDITLPEANRKEDSDIEFFTKEERIKIVEEATRTYKDGRHVYHLGWMFVLLMYSGMRAGEVCALTWDDVDFSERTINVRKNAVEVREKDENGESHYVLKTQNSTKTRSGTRIIPMTEKAYTALSELQKITGDCEYIVSSSKGQRIRPSRIDRSFHLILDAIGLKRVGVHTLRHTFATMLFHNGCDIKVVSELLGHSNTKITENIYIHVIQEQKVKAIQSIDKFSD